MSCGVPESRHAAFFIAMADRPAMFQQTYSRSISTHHPHSPAQSLQTPCRNVQTACASLQTQCANGEHKAQKMPECSTWHTFRHIVYLSLERCQKPI